MITVAITTLSCNINDGVIHEEIKQEIVTTTRIQMSPTNDANHTNNTTARCAPVHRCRLTTRPQPWGLQHAIIVANDSDVGDLD